MEKNKKPSNAKHIPEERNSIMPAVPGVNTPGINVPVIEPEIFPPPPNRAWTAMSKGLDIDDLSEEEKADLYMGRDNLF